MSDADRIRLLEQRVALLEHENAKLERIKNALIERVEGSSSGALRADAYAAFEHSVVLAEQVRERTEALNTALADLKQSNESLKRANHEAAIAHQRLIDAIESISDAFVLFDRERRIILFNSKFRQYWAGTGTEIECGITISDVKRLAHERGLIAEEQIGHDHATIYRLSNGRWVQMSERITGDDGLVILYNDITALKASEAAQREQALAQQYAETLRESERWIRLITDHVPALIAYIGDDLCYQFTNQVYDDWYGWPRGSLLGETIQRAHGVQQFASLQPYIEQALLGESVTFEIDEHNAAGQLRHMLKSYVPNREANGQTVGFFVLIRDITERKRTALALQEAYQHLEQRVRERTSELTEVNHQMRQEISERRAVEGRLREAKREAEQANLSKTKFLAAVSHDLLQPLNAARLFTSALLEQPVPDKVASLVNSVSHSLEDVESLLGTLVDISKLDAGVIKPDISIFKINSLIDNIAAEYEHVASAESLRFSYQPSSAVVVSDMTLLARILRNLLSNAARYTSTGGRILLGCRRSATTLKIQVWDTGCGIPADKLEEIFLEFKRVQQARPVQDKGLGLGLAIVDKISKMLSHPISVRSVEGKGSLFTLEVPLGVLAPATDQARDVTPGVDQQLQGSRIWMIDNDPAICKGMEVLLSGWGCEVHVAIGLEALQAQLDITSEPVDLLIMDYHLDNDDSGIEVVNEMVRLRGESLPVLMITANYSNDLKQEIRERGYLLLHKPVRPMKLKAALSHMLTASVDR